MVSQMEEVSTKESMVIALLVSSKMGCCMGKLKKLKLMGKSLMDNMKMAIEVVKAHFVSQIIQYIREISNKINKVASEYTHGPMAENIKENGKMTNFMVWEFILRNKNFIVDNSKIINNQDLEYYNKKE